MQRVPHKALAVALATAGAFFAHVAAAPAQPWTVTHAEQATRSIVAIHPDGQAYGGTAFKRDDGYWLTAFHVVRGAVGRPMMIGRTIRTARVRSVSRYWDLALLSSPTMTSATLTLTPHIYVGEAVTIVGMNYNRWPRQPTYLAGTGTVLGQIPSVVCTDGSVEHYQLVISGYSQSGESGGPVIDTASGQVVGVVTAGTADHTYTLATPV